MGVDGDVGFGCHVGVRYLEQHSMAIFKVSSDGDMLHVCKQLITQSKSYYPNNVVLSPTEMQ